MSYVLFAFSLSIEIIIFVQVRSENEFTESHVQWSAASHGANFKVRK